MKFLGVLIYFIFMIAMAYCLFYYLTCGMSIGFLIRFGVVFCVMCLTCLGKDHDYKLF